MFRGDSSDSVLTPGMLNVVGKSHNESKPRRAAAKQFAKERTGSDNYWTEDEFPDMQANFGVREEHQPDEQSGADLMEYRAIHGVTLLIKESEKVVAVAAKIGTIKIDNLTPDKVQQLGHKRVSETLDTYLGRAQPSPKVAKLLDVIADSR